MLCPAKAAARKPMKVMTSWSTARNRPGWLMSRSTRCAPLVALVDELLETAPADRDERDLGGHEHAR